MKELYYLFLFIVICFVTYMLFRGFYYNPMLIEGMTNSDSTDIASSGDGIAANAASYAASLKSEVIRAEDELLISKYRTDYETSILNLDDLINTRMLNISLSADPSNLKQTLIDLSQCQQAKSALNSVMKYVDSK
jgi:hypothetical protein